MHRALLFGLLLFTTHLWAEEASKTAETPKPELTQTVAADSLMPPEREVQYALYRLENLKHKFNGDQLFRLETPGSQPQQAKRLLRLGEEKFAKKEWFTTIALLEQFLAVSQAASGEDYLKAHRILGLSYEEAGDTEKARQAYQNFLASYMTRPAESETELLDVLRRLLPLTKNNDAQLSALLAPLASLRISQKQKAEVFFYAGLNLAKAGRKDLALNWFREARNLTESPRLKAGSTYHIGVLALEDNDFSKAQREFDQCIAMKEDETKDYRDLAHIGLGRIAIVEKKPDLAKKHYESVTTDSSAAADAMFENIYVHVALKDFAKAKELSQAFTQKYPRHPQLHLINTIKGYLDIKAGEWGKAKETIAVGDKDLGRLEEWVRQKFKKPQEPHYRDLVELAERTEGQLVQPPVVTRSLQLFNRLAQLEDRLGRVRNDSRSLLYGVGAAHIRDLQPAELARFAQLEEYLEEGLDVGHRLAALEFQLFQEKLSEKEKAELVASQKRRQMLFSPAAKLRATRGDWQSYARLAELQGKMSSSMEKLLMAKAEVAGLMNEVLVRQPAEAKAKLDSLRKLQQDLALRLEQASRAMELVRAQQIQTMAEFGPQRPLMRRVRQYATSLFEESAITGAYRNRVKNPQSRFMMEDLHKTWEQWEFVLKGLYEQLAQEDKVLNKKLKMMATSTEGHIMRYDQLATRMFALNRQVGSTLSINAEGIVAYYQDQIEERIARHKKWQADLEWLAYDKENAKKGEVDRKYELEQQMLQDNLRNLQQGASLPWQN